MKYYVYLVLFVMAAVRTNVCAQEKDEKAPYIKVEGEVAQPLTLYQSDLEKMKKVTVKHKGHEKTAHSYTGVPVMEILSRAGVTLGKELRGKNLTKYLLVVAADGYKVVFSLAELDSVFNNKQVILSYKMDGKPLPGEQGIFQLIVPDEKKPARSCRQVTSFIISSAKD